MRRPSRISEEATRTLKHKGSPIESFKCEFEIEKAEINLSPNIPVDSPKLMSLVVNESTLLQPSYRQTNQQDQSEFISIAPKMDHN